jgi:RES domain
MSKPRVPDPPADLRTKRLKPETLPAGTRFQNFYGIAHPAGSFNPGRGAGRFHPIYAPRGEAIPTLYAGNSWEGAAMETILRTMPSERPPTAVPRALVDRYGACQIELQRDVLIMPLEANNLRILRLVRAQLLEPGPKHYPRTARWAEAIYATFPKVEGLRWFSRQFDGAQSLLFFGDRVKRSLSVIEDLGGCSAGLARATIERIASAAEITITEP